MNAFSAVYQATARQFLRDRMAILLTLLLPLVLTALFGSIFSGGQAAGPAAYSFLPGMLCIAVLWLGVFATAPNLVQMREEQALRRLQLTPLKRRTFFAAQVAWRLTIGLIQGIAILLLGAVVWKIRVMHWLPFAGFEILGNLLFISLGYALAAVSSSPESVGALGQVVQFPMMFLSGSLFPVEMLPRFLRPAAALMPLTYLGDALRQTLLGSPAVYPLWLDLAVLGGCLVALATVAVRYFRWE